MNVADEDLEAIETRQRFFEAVSSPLTASTVVEDIQNHQWQRVMVLYNTVAQAQGLQNLRDLVEDQAIKISLLHSRFLIGDRKQKKAALRQTFGKEGYQQNEQFYPNLFKFQE